MAGTAFLQIRLLQQPRNRSELGRYIGTSLSKIGCFLHLRTDLRTR